MIVIEKGKGRGKEKEKEKTAEEKEIDLVNVLVHAHVKGVTDVIVAGLHPAGVIAVAREAIRLPVTLGFTRRITK